MKWLFACALFMLLADVSIAQKVPTPHNAPTDSVRSSTVKKGKIKMVDGVAMNSGVDVIYNLSKSNNYSMFVNAVRTAGLLETFKSRGPMTFFVPDNSAFNTMPAGRLDTLLKQNHLLELNNLLTYHAVPGNLKAKDIADLIEDNKGQAILTTVAGGKITARVDNNRNIVLTDEMGGQSIISRFDIPQSNGIVHIVTKVLIPKYKTI